MNVDLVGLAAFAEVAEAGSFTAAARKLGQSKAAVSRQVGQLEERLGVLLLARTTRRLTLTEAGERVLARARRIREEVDALSEEAGETRASPRGRVRLSAPLALALSCLADRIPAFLRGWPEIELEMALSDQTGDLIAGGFDLGLRVGSMPDSSLRVRAISPVRLHLVAAPSYWQARGKPDRPEELALHSAIRYANSASGNVWVFDGEAGQRVRVPVTGPLCVDNGAAELPAIRAGLGCAILPDFLIADDVAAGRLEPALCDWNAGQRTLHLLFPPGAGRPRRVQVVADWLVEVLQQQARSWQVA